MFKQSRLFVLVVELWAMLVALTISSRVTALASQRMHFVADVQGVGRGNGAEVECQHLLRGFASARLYAQKKSFLYAERDDARREEFLEQLSHIAPEDRVYVDEAGVEDTLSWAYGWSRKGSRCQGERLGHRTSRILIQPHLDGRCVVLWPGAVAFDISGLLRQCACGKLV